MSDFLFPNYPFESAKPDMDALNELLNAMRLMEEATLIHTAFRIATVNAGLPAKSAEITPEQMTALVAELKPLANGEGVFDAMVLGVALVAIANGASDPMSLATAALQMFTDDEVSISAILNGRLD